MEWVVAIGSLYAFCAPLVGLPIYLAMIGWPERTRRPASGCTELVPAALVRPVTGPASSAPWLRA